MRSAPRHALEGFTERDRVARGVRLRLERAAGPRRKPDPCSRNEALIDLSLDVGRLAGTSGTGGRSSPGTRRARRRTYRAAAVMRQVSTAAATSTKWFKALEGAGDVDRGVSRQIRATSRAWIVDRSAARGASPSSGTRPRRSPSAARETFSRAPRKSTSSACFVEGRTISVEDVMGTVADSARFGAFDLIDPALEGDGARDGENSACSPRGGRRADPHPRLAGLGDSRGVRVSRPELESGARLDDVLRRGFGGWWRRRHVVQRAVSRHAPQGLGPVARRRRRRVDRILKGARRHAPVPRCAGPVTTDGRVWSGLRWQCAG